MHKNRLEGAWTEVKGIIKQNWARLSDDELKKINGKYEELRGSLQWHYGYSKEEAEEKINKVFRLKH